MLSAGKPLTQGTVTFIPVDENGQVATGQIQSDGSFELETAGSGTGAAVGDYKIKVETELTKSGSKPGLAIVAIPPKYQDEDASGLTATIRPEPSDLKPFVLR